MATASLPELKERLVVPAVSSSYPTLGASYKHGGYEVNHANKLVRTGRNYYDSKAEIPEGLRMSTAGEEIAIQLAIERAGKDPRKAEVFNDLFGRKNSGWYAWQWTETFLRIPSSKQNPGKPDYVDTQGRKYWTREFGNGNEVVGVVYVPEGGNRVVPKTNDLLDVWDLITGLPRVTSDGSNDTRYGNHTTHFWFNATPDRDSTSGHYDVAVGRRSGWHHDVGERCLAVAAGDGRLDAPSGGGFRRVRGSGPEGPKIEKKLVEKPSVQAVTELVQQLDPAQIEQAFIERVRTDYRSMPHPDFLKKYDL